MAKRRFLVTSALPYSNGRLHVGHIAGAYLPADTFVRYLRAMGDDVRFICGSDDNGVAALIAAKKEGTTVEELTRRYHDRQAADFIGMGVHFDIYGGTHQPDCVEVHNRISQGFFKSIYDKGYFAKKTTTQLFDEKANQFLPDRYVKGTCYYPDCGKPNAYGDQCEACGRQIDPVKLINPVSTITGTTPVPKQTTHWYLQLQKFEEPLRQWLESKRQGAPGAPAWRDAVLNFSLGQIKQGLPERAMTRDLQWGVPVPLEDPDAKGKVLYVWFDAPIGYVSFTAKWCQDHEGNADNYARYWKDPDCKIAHFIGEDNTVFHALTWPAMLMAEGSFQLPWQVVANAFLNIKFPGKEEEKISKSRGTAIWIEDYLKTFEPDALRYYLTAIAPEAQRTAFDVDDFIQKNNSELADNLGNFFNRWATFAVKYFDGKVPPVGQRGEDENRMIATIAEQAQKIAEHLENLRFKAALVELMALSRAGNVYFDAKAPWKLRKTDMDACGTVINVCIQVGRALTTLMAPFLPFSAQKCRQQLNLLGSGGEGIDAVLPWREATVELPEGHALGTPEVLFKKIDAKTVFGEELK